MPIEFGQRQTSVPSGAQSRRPETHPSRWHEMVLDAHDVPRNEGPAIAITANYILSPLPPPPFEDRSEGSHPSGL